MKLNIGAGDKRFEGYTGVDVVQRKAVDIVAPAHQIPLPDGCAEEILAIHIIEHLVPWELPLALAEWARLLVPDGALIIEAPDLMKACRNIIEGREGKHPNQMGLWALFGDDRTHDPHMLHRYAYSFLTLEPLVKAAGFVDIVERETVFHAIGRGVRDLRLEARKPSRG